MRADKYFLVLRRLFNLLTLHCSATQIPALISLWALFICHSSSTNRLITAKDHSSVQINIGRVNENGVLTGEFDTIALCGFVRRKGLGDEAFYRIAKTKGFWKESK